MTTLYIIGNGFDLWHKLPTDYGSFYAYAKDSLDDMATYYVNEELEGKPWHDFENCLGTYNWILFFNYFNEVDITSESFRPRDVYGLEDEIKEQSHELVENIKTLFNEWVLHIDVSVAHEKMTFEPNSKFLTFNYTETLQKVYGIAEKDVLHIHGNAYTYEELIFGHGKSREEEPEIDENGDSNRTMFTDAEDFAKYPFYALKKPVQEILAKNSGYFSSLTNVTTIVVIGHSLNDIDLPYFQEISRNAPGCLWKVHCYQESEFGHHKLQLERCGVNAECILKCTYD